MRHCVRPILLSASGLLLLIGCIHDYPNPATPMLALVRLHAGQQVCPSGGCGAAVPPTSAATTWLLDPDTYQINGKTHANRRAVLVMDTPSLTELRVSHTAKNQTVMMKELPRTAGDPAFPDEFRIANTDDGTMKRWFVTVMVNYCVTPITFHFVNVGNDPGNPTSAPLDVTLMLTPPSIGTGCSTGHDFNPSWYAASSSSSSSTTSGSGSSACPPGHTLFTVCEACAASAGATKIYMESSGCYTSFSSLQTVYGYTGSGKSGCTLTQGHCP